MILQSKNQTRFSTSVFLERVYKNDLEKLVLFYVLFSAYIFLYKSGTYT